MSMSKIESRRSYFGKEDRSLSKDNKPALAGEDHVGGCASDEKLPEQSAV